MDSSSLLSHRHIYKQDQISDYFDVIALPSRLQHEVPSLHHEGHEERALEFLRLLQIHQLATIPFENLSLHYSSHHDVSIDPDALYQKIVTYRRGRGGYCMENNCFFGTMLRSLGFNIFSAGARVSEDGRSYAPWYVMPAIT